MTPDDQDHDDGTESSNPSLGEVTIVGGPSRLGETAEICLRRLGRYELLDEVGRGSFARVYRARDPRLKREVAIKALRTEFVHDEHMIARVYREARAAAQLRHPAIVPVHEVGEDGGQAFIVTDFVPGGTLDDVLRDGEPAHDDTARTVARVADALHYAHQYGVVHRDIKPANIMTDAGGEPVVADFGLAMHVDAEMTLSEGGGVVGTPAYMAPEQASGASPVDGRADVYALGVVLFRMLTGRLPFEGGWTATLHMVISVDPPTPRSIKSSIPVDLETITLRAMAKAPSDRYATAAELADDLRRYLDHLPIRARRRGPLGRTVLWARRNPMVATTLLAALAVVSVVVALAFARVARERDLFLDQRDESNANLYRALVGEASALSQARDTGWWWRVLDNVEAAARLDVDVRDPVELQRLAIATLGTTLPSLRVHRVLDGHRGPVLDVAIGEGFVVTLAVDGLRAWTLPEGEPIGAPFGTDDLGEGQYVRGVAALDEGPGLVSIDDSGRLRSWTVGGGDVVPRRTVAIPAPLCLDVGPGARVAVGCADGRIRILDDGDRMRVLPDAHGAPVVAVSFDRSTPERLVSAGRDLAIRVHDLMAGTPASVSPVIDPPTDVLLAGRTVFMSSVPSYGVLRIDLDGGDGEQARLHDGGVPDIAFDSAGRLVSVGHDGAIKIVSAALKQLAVGEADLGDAHCVAASRDDRFLAAGYDGGRAVVWERARPGFRRAARGSHRIGWLPDGTRYDDRSVGGRLLAASPLTSIGMLAGTERYVTGGADGAVVVRTLGGEVVVEVPDEYGHATVVAALDGASVACSRGERVLVLDAATGDVLHDVPVGPGIDRIVPGVGGAFAVRHESGVSLARPVDGEYTLGHLPRGAATIVAGRLFVGHASGLSAMDVATGAVVKTSGAGKITALASHPRSDLLICLGEGGELSVCEEAGAPGEHVADLPADVLRVIPDPEAWRAIVIRHGGRTEVWDLDTGVPLAELYRVAATDAVFLDDDHVLLATSNGEVRGLDLTTLLADRRASVGDESAASNTTFIYRRTGTLVAGGHPDAIWGVAASADGAVVATCGHDSTTKLWDAETGRLLRTIVGHSGVAWSLAFDAAGDRIATGSGGRIVVSEVATGRELSRIDAHGEALVSGVAIAPDGRLMASTGYDGTARLWDLESGRELAVLVRIRSAAHDVKFSPDGQWLAVAANDERVRLWDLRSPAVRAALARHENADMARDESVELAPTRTIRLDSVPWAVGFDPSSPRLAAACEDGGIRMWQAPTEAAAPVRLDSDAALLRSVAFDPEGGRIAAGAFAGPGVVWDLTALGARLAELGVPAW